MKETKETMLSNWFWMFVAAVKKIKKPSATNPPLGLSKKGLSKWPEFWEKYGKQLQKVKNVEDRWAAAVSIWRNWAIKRNIPPFAPTQAPELDQDAREAMANRLSNARIKVANKLRSTIRKLVRADLISKVAKEKLISVDYNGQKGGYVVVTLIKATLTKGSKLAEFSEPMAKLGFFKKGSKFEVKLASHTISVQVSKTYLEATCTMIFTPQQIKYFLDLTDDDLKNKNLVIKKLFKAMRKEHKETAIDKHDVMASTMTFLDEDEIDFEQELDKPDQLAISEIISGLKGSDLSQAAQTFTLAYIRSLGDPLFQYVLTKRLVDLFESSGQPVPTSWRQILESPNRLLNPIVWLKEDDEFFSEEG